MIEMIEMMPEVTWPVPNDGKQYPCVKCQPASD